MISFLVEVGLALTLIFASPVYCDTNFVRPAPWDRNQDADEDPRNNRRYDAGDTIHVIWETDLDKVDVVIWTKDGGVSDYGYLSKQQKSTDISWIAEYDARDRTKSNEDSVYWFALYEPGVNSPVARSQYVNVSAPEAHETKTVIVSRTISFKIQESSTTKLILTPTTESNAESTTEPTTTGPFSSQDTSLNDATTKSGLSGGAIAGIAVGATLGGLLFLGGTGWLIWKRLAKSRKDPDVPNGLQSQQQQESDSGVPKAELPGYPETHSSNFARSVPGLHEAP
ncbi:hypothetical protein FSARC_8543 [Fusarium sarcochroum]|uniref:Mid2 domain-containing protein n=1 Tax=Fusarium sarcochroum TaxID=1208366 RepID=A0A8H4TSU8_9HYPO|nr:hypothetical protein FSARC_8543 [Fusarium sarcochroum]